LLAVRGLIFSAFAGEIRRVLLLLLEFMEINNTLASACTWDSVYQEPKDE
jgi:hypothetical protein